MSKSRANLLFIVSIAFPLNHKLVALLTVSGKFLHECEVGYACAHLKVDYLYFRSGETCFLIECSYDDHYAIATGLLR